MAGECLAVTCADVAFSAGVATYSSNPVHVPGSTVEYGCGVAGPNLPGTLLYMDGVEYVAGSLQPRDGDSVRVCQADGSWNGSAPTTCPPCCSATTCCGCLNQNSGCYVPDFYGVGSDVETIRSGIVYLYGFDAWWGECNLDDDYCGCQCGRMPPRSCGMGPNGECGADDDCDRAC